MGIKWVQNRQFLSFYSHSVSVLSNDIRKLITIYQKYSMNGTLLFQYFYEDYDKLQKILGSKFVNEKEMKIREDWKTDDTLFLDALRSLVSNN